MMSLLSFPFVESYFSTRLGTELSSVQSGQLCVVETSRRLEPEQSYQYLRVGWLMQLHDGRAVLSIPPETGPAAREIISTRSPLTLPVEQNVLEDLQHVLDMELERRSMPRVDGRFTNIIFACNASLLRKYPSPHCRWLTDTSLPSADGFAWPPYTFLDGVLYGVIADDKVVSVASVRPTGIHDARVVDIGIETAPAYQRCGYAGIAVSALVEHITVNCGEAIYICRPENKASIATARKVGFVEIGRSIIIRAPLS